MTITGYRIIAWQQHWRLIDGHIYRDAIAVRITDGSLRTIAVKEDQ